MSGEKKGELERVKAARKYALACAELQRRIEAGEPDDALDAERERLADEWYRLPEEDAAGAKALMTARGGAE